MLRALEKGPKRPYMYPNGACRGVDDWNIEDHKQKNQLKTTKIC